MQLLGRNADRLLRVVVVCAVGATIGTRDSRANGPEVISVGASIVPVASTSIQLVREYVDVALPSVGGQLGGEVQCRYFLRNRDKNAINLQMAFITGERDEPYGDVVRTFSDSRFKVVCVDPRHPYRIYPEAHIEKVNPSDWQDLVQSPPDSLPVWTVMVPADTTVILTISYDIWWGARWIKSEDKVLAVFRYNARPASLWAGRLEDAEFNFRMPSLNGHLMRCLLEECASGQLTPPGYEWVEDGVRWRFTNWKPDCDLEISLVPDTK